VATQYKNGRRTNGAANIENRFKVLKKEATMTLCLAGQPCSFTKYTYIANTSCICVIYRFYHFGLRSCLPAGA